MNGNRKAAEAVAIEFANDLVPSGSLANLYRKAFSEMNDLQFEEWVRGLEDGSVRFAVVVPNFTEDSKAFTAQHLVAVGKKWGHEFFERVWLPTPSGQLSLSNFKSIILELMFRRQAQILEDKISLPKNNNTIDIASGQATGDSKGSRLSSVELGVLDNLNLPEAILELIKARGGDTDAFRMTLNSIHRTGEASLEEIGSMGTEVVAKRTLSSMFTSQHLANNL